MKDKIFIWTLFFVPQISLQVPQSPLQAPRASPRLSAFGQAKLAEIRQKKAQRAQQSKQIPDKCLWDESQQTSLPDQIELRQEEQEWIDQEEAERKYQDIKADLQSLKISQQQIQNDVSGLHDLMASLKEDMSLIKDMSTQVAQVFLDAPITGSQTPTTSMAPIISDPDLVTRNQT